MKHTELPWEVETHNHVCDEQWNTIVKGAIDITHNTQPHEIACDKYSSLSQEENEANAAFIVKAVNNHENLLSALKFMISALQHKELSFGDKVALDEAREAVKQAEEE